jgi:excisionase family DNA binding protein
MIEKLAYSVKEAATASGISKSLVYQKIKAGELPAKRLGVRTLILADDLQAFLGELTPWKSKYEL